MENKNKNSLSPEQNCRLIIDPIELDGVLKLEDALFDVNTFHYNREFLLYPFRENLHTHLFFEDHDFFRERNRYESLIDFLKSVQTSSFFISSPAYCGLYPLQVSVDCPYTVYNLAVSYVLEESVSDSNQKLIRRPVGHPMSGAGFVIMPHVFMYDSTKRWAILLEDSVTPVAIVGLKESVVQEFTTCLKSFKLMSISGLIEKRATETYLANPEKRIIDTYKALGR